VLTRLAFKSNKTKIIYTAHGFQFYKGGALKDWILFFPIEFLLSFNTTALLTINNEDTSLAEKYFRTKVMQIPGVGIDFSEIQNKLNDKSEYNFIRSTLNIDKNSKIMISVGELNARKNQRSVITALGKIKNTNLHYVICGIGPDEDKLKNLTKELELENNVHFLGYTNNVPEYLVASDFSVFLSRREGLGLAGLESMAAGLPLISSNLNGIKDYTTDGITGFTVNDPVDIDEIVEAIKKMMNLDDETFSEISHENQKIAKKYSIESVNIKMNDIYSQFL
jgi:glycosyltransferase involved in cell wall biosynthesis